jgi:hypothetical protein
MAVLPDGTVCGIMGSITSSAQTVRGGDAGPVRGLLGGKDLTGCFLCEPNRRLFCLARERGVFGSVLRDPK